MNNYRRKRDFRRGYNSGNNIDSCRLLKSMLSENGISASTPETKDFIRWMTTEAWNNYQKDRMDKKIIVKNRIDSHPIVIPNATKGSIIPLR